MMAAFSLSWVLAWALKLRGRNRFPLGMMSSLV